jgi:hypothetical protein
LFCKHGLSGIINDSNSVFLRPVNDSGIFSPSIGGGALIAPKEWLRQKANLPMEQRSQVAADYRICFELCGFHGRHGARFSKHI